MDFAIRSRFRKWEIPGKCRRSWASRGVGPGEARRWNSPIFDIDADVDVVKRERDASGVGIAKDAWNDGTFGMATSVGYLRSCLAAWTCTQALNRLILGVGRTPSTWTYEDSFWQLLATWTLTPRPEGYSRGAQRSATLGCPISDRRRQPSSGVRGGAYSASRRTSAADFFG